MKESINKLPLLATKYGWIYTGLCAVLGLILIIWPGESVWYVYYAAAAAVSLLGLWRVFKYFRDDADEGREHQVLASGIMLFIAGLMMLIYAGRLQDWLPVILAMACFLLFAIRTQGAVDLQRMKFSFWYLLLIAAAAMLALALVILLAELPLNTAVILTGCAALLEAIADACGRVIFLRLRKAKKQADSAS